MTRPLSELVNPAEPGLVLVRDWMSRATRPVELLPCDPARGKETLLSLQVTTRSPMGALAYETGGLLVDDGWVRVLGASCDRLPRGLADWNRIGGDRRLPGALLVGDDALGGFFAVNGGGLRGRAGNVFYLAPDTLEWEELEMSYSDWLVWLFEGDVELFYEELRWSTWRDDVRKLGGEQGFLVYPFLFTNESAIEEPSREPVPMAELWHLYAVELPRQLELAPD